MKTNRGLNYKTFEDDCGEDKEQRFLRAWERNGTRRPFPPLYEAAKKYGDRIYYHAPDYVAPKHCKWCGKPLSGRRTSYCCKEHSREYNNITVWNRGRDPYSLRILYRDNFSCRKCGEFHAFRNEFGIIIPIDDGKLHVHHILPVSEGGGDEPENLMTLCVECHREIHRKYYNDG